MLWIKNNHSGIIFPEDKINPNKLIRSLKRHERLIQNVTESIGLTVQSCEMNLYQSASSHGLIC